MPRLKVFRTPIGFHDAFVAAPSQKAALAAWGSDANLFARGVAEEVTDPELTAEPLAHPGMVIRKLRGTVEEQIAALPKDTLAPKAAASKPRSRRPKPSRAKLDDAEAALQSLEAAHAAEEAKLVVREQQLALERRKITERQAAERDRAAQEVAKAGKAYEAAVADWTG